MTKIKPYLLRDIAEDYGLIETNYDYGMSLMFDCKFYKTKFQNIYITDYDLKNHKDYEISDNLFIIFYRKAPYFNYEIISGELIKDKDIFETILKDFYIICAEYAQK